MTPEQPRRLRPKRTRVELFGFDVTEAVRMAEEDGVSLSNWIRHLVMAEVRRRQRAERDARPPGPDAVRWVNPDMEDA